MCQAHIIRILLLQTLALYPGMSRADTGQVKLPSACPVGMYSANWGGVVKAPNFQSLLLLFHVFEKMVSALTFSWGNYV